MRLQEGHRVEGHNRVYQGNSQLLIARREGSRRSASTAGILELR